MGLVNTVRGVDIRIGADGVFRFEYGEDHYSFKTYDQAKNKINMLKAKERKRGPKMETPAWFVVMVDSESDEDAPDHLYEVKQGWYCGVNLQTCEHRYRLEGDKKVTQLSRYSSSFGKPTMFPSEAKARVFAALLNEIAWKQHRANTSETGMALAITVSGNSVTMEDYEKHVRRWLETGSWEGGRHVTS